MGDSRQHSAAYVAAKPVVIVCCLGLMLGGCSSTSAFVADYWPHWAGGLPRDAPPRPGAPGYNEFIAHGQPGQDAQAVSGATNSAVAERPAPADNRTVPQPPPAASHSPNDSTAVQGGLY